MNALTYSHQFATKAVTWTVMDLRSTAQLEKLRFQPAHALVGGNLR